MKLPKMIFAKMTVLVMMLLMVNAINTNAQTHKTTAATKDCCMMKDGKMMVTKNGITMPMEKDMVMKNGTTCKTNGDCKMKNGKTMKMKDGDCMEMSGKMCAKNMKHMTTGAYSCPMHPEVTSAKTGKCPKCNMALVKKS